MRNFAELPKTAHLIEVGPRDGLQSEPDFFPTAAKIEMIRRAVRAGIREIEATSFVHPKRVPQMQDAAEVIQAVLPELPPEIELIALVPNEKGFERAVAAGLRKVRLVLTASQTFHRKNFNQSIEETQAEFAQVFARGKAAGVNCVGIIAASWGCPYEGRVAVEQPLRLAAGLEQAGATEIFFADTTGMAVPTTVNRLLQEAVARISVPVGVHFHNTRSTGYANVVAALQAGINRFDTSLGGLGGCPFAPRATGNIATEDTAHMLNEMGIETGTSLEQLISTVTWLEASMGKKLPGQLSKAGPAFL